MSHRRTEAQREIRKENLGVLRKAILQEQYERLEEEAAEFFSTPSKTDRVEAKAIQKASMISLSRD
jgi:hypothetical protein